MTASAAAPAAAPRAPRVALAKLEGRIFYADRDAHHFVFFMQADQLTLGRSDPAKFPAEPLAPAQRGVDVGVGDSNKLSRTHARIRRDPNTSAFLLSCLGKNGLTATLPSSEETVVMTPDTPPVALQSRTLVQMGDAIFCFVLPAEYPPTPRRRREWIKAETSALRTLMMRLGYGRWRDIITSASGRLCERAPDELIPVARRFVARCYIHARPGVEQKVLAEILREDVPPDADHADHDVDALIADAKAAEEPGEKRKFVRWARKLKLLRRLRDVHDHSSVERLGAGQLRVFTPRPAPYWTDADDVDLIRGVYKHGYGLAEAIRKDPELGFHDRYLPLPSNRRPKPKPKPPTGTAADDDDDHEDDEDDVEEDDDDATSAGGGDTAKKVKKEKSVSRDASPSVSHGEVDESDSALSAKAEDVPAAAAATGAATGDAVKAEAMVVVKREADVVMADRESTPAKKEEDMAVVVVEANGTSSHTRKVEKVTFPTSEALMKRLKSVINSCAKEYDRDVRERRRQTQARDRAQQRKADLEARKREKAAEKLRLREERKMAKSQPFSKKDAVEFEKALANFGLLYKDDAQTADWDAFIAAAPQFQNKYTETLENAFTDFNAEAHRLVELAAAKEDEDEERLRELEKQTPSTMFTQLTLERAERVLERLRFFRTLRGEVLKNPGMSTILRGCKRTKELPLWWRSTHDTALLRGVDKHGFNAWEALATDEQLVFAKSIKMHEEKYRDDAKTLKKGAFPKASAAAKRAINLVSNFRTKLMDPHYQRQIEAAAHEKSSAGEKRERDDVSGSDVAAAPPSVEGHSSPPPPSQPNGVVVVTDAQSSTTTPLDLVDRNGHILLPADVGEGLFLLELGEIATADAFHSEHSLYPPGYRAVRVVGSDAYLCEIIRRPHVGDRPVFRVSRLHGFQTHDGTQPMWESSHVVAENCDIQHAWIDPAPSVDERFGLHEPTVVHYLQQLPDAQLCTRYKTRSFSAAAAGALHSDNTTTTAAARDAPATNNKHSSTHSQTGIFQAMTDALARKRHADAPSNHSPQEMNIPSDWTRSYGSAQKKRKMDDVRASWHAPATA